jgi:hypothetical protein
MEGSWLLALLHNFHLEAKACLLLDLGITIILYADEWRNMKGREYSWTNWSVGETP